MLSSRVISKPIGLRQSARSGVVCNALQGRAIQRAGKKPQSGGDDGITAFLVKLQQAWEIFFPPPPKQELSAKDEVKRRLRMVLVADRAGLSPGAMQEMKLEIVDTIRKYVEIQADEEVEVNVQMDPEHGTVYSVNVPVRRVRAVVRQPAPGKGNQDITIEWDDGNWDADPSNRFPMGT